MNRENDKKITAKNNRHIDNREILVVDDEVPNLQLLTQLLSAEDYVVRPAETAQLAIDSALARPPNLILLDVRMPVMDGFEVCRRLKQDARTSDIPIIFVSALDDVEDRVRGFEAGGVDFISKPFHEVEVLARISTHMKLHIMQRHLEELVSKRTADLQLEITERETIEEQLRHSQKLEVAGQLTGGIVHDFNNILGIIMGNLRLLERQAKDNPEILHYAEEALEATRRGAELNKKLLSFASQEPSSVKLEVVNKFVTNIVGLVATSLTASINVETHLADDLWPVEIDPGDLENALLNLAINARDAMPEGGQLIIETANKALDDNYVRRNPSAKAGEFVMITVSDTGSGMTIEVKEKVFEPFFTTKKFGLGSGLGLSMVYGFVERSGGHIKVYSEPGTGTTFRIYLPRVHERARRADTAQKRQTELPCGSETILIVDDEKALLDVAVLYLEDLGYKILTAKDGKQALEVLKDHPDIDLLFTDVIMPGDMDGYQLAKAAHEIRLTLKVLLTSGFTSTLQEHANGDGGYLKNLASNLLSKPYNDEELAFAIRRVLST